MSADETSTATTRQHTAAVVALLVLAVSVRLWCVGHARFTSEEATFWGMARNIATFTSATSYGPALTGSEAMHPGPLFYFVMAVPALFGRSPWLGGAFVALLHGLAGYLGYDLARSMRGPRAGLIFLALFLFAPWDVLYGDRVWLSCVAPVWGTAMLWSAHKSAEPAREGGERAREFHQALFVFLALVCPQFHMSAPLGWAACFVVLYFARPFSVSRRAVALGAFGAFLAYLSPIIWELTHGLSNTRAILRHGGGRASAAAVLASPLRVFGYAVLYASGEVGYHFERGYWRVFDEAQFYFSAAGLREYLRTRGAAHALLNAASVLVSLLAWGRAFVRCVEERGALRTSLEARVRLALVTGLAAAVALLVVSRKGYYPHYTNLLMPLLLLPVAMELARVELRALRWGAIAVTAGAMAVSTVRYYREVDGLNGLRETQAMVARVAREPGPVEVHFGGYDNRDAWAFIAQTQGVPLRIEETAPTVFVVRNGARFTEPTPPGGAWFGPVLLERRGPSGR